MRVLIISTDKNILLPGSSARERMLEYGKLFEELHIIVVNKEGNFSNQTQSNVFIYPTNTRFILFYLGDILGIAGRILESNSISDFIITAQDFAELGLAGYILKKKYNIPLQIQVHTDVFSPYFKKQSCLNRIRVFLAKILLLKADGIRVVSLRIKNSIKEKGSKIKTDPVVSPIFVDVKGIKAQSAKFDLHNKYPQNNFIVLMASRLTKEKNILLAVEVFKEVIKKFPKVLLLIVGDGPEKEKIEQRINSLGLIDNVVIESWNEDLISYYKTADMFLLTSNYEGYGRTVVEAMAAGLPVVMTDVGLAGDILVNEKNGLVVKVDDKIELIRAILRMLEDKNLRNHFIGEAYSVLQNMRVEENIINESLMKK